MPLSDFRNPTELDAAYLAGFFDGEGTLGIYYVRDNHRGNRNRNRFYLLQICLCNTQKEVLEYLQSIWGGVLRSSENHGWGKIIHNLCWKSQPDALQVLPRIIPYLKLKKEQAELIVKWSISRQNRPSHKAGYTDEEIEIAQQISELASAKGRRRHDRAISSGVA